MFPFTMRTLHNIHFSGNLLFIKFKDIVVTFKKEKMFASLFILLLMPSLRQSRIIQYNCQNEIC